ncbi:PIR protein [Plasmodium yoelii]|uniref:PIR protein n=2 Tax=Plasmodium yoelii TaxID=5861 RepID=A0AAE9WX96_PLAYO|nr:PIR protein [Plasmodium yoelii]WBY58264.1 PIR protein [Plasmodium yoelii yoelii]CDS44874.1 YIR protein [Plasmodium yoelii]VTZ79184.1 PIR protein [Plasmodium yoelii]|eukprot:XP_022813443.1 PIR protein [Plasmodium yoelii]
MDNTLCRRFDTLRNYLPDDLSKPITSDINRLGNIKNYCSNEESGKTECKTDLDKINGGCIWLFEQLFVKNQNDINIVEYIIIWLSYKLNQKLHEGINNLNDFYEAHIMNNTYYNKCDNGGQDCSNSLKEIMGYTNYKEIIDNKKELLNTNFEYMSKFYDAFKSLCNMYTELNANDTTDKKYLENAKEFVKKYKQLNEDSGISGDSSYRQILSTLSNDYNNFKNYCSRSKVDCSDIPLLPDIKTKENGVQNSDPSSEHISEVTSSSSSIKNKLIPFVSIIVAIPIFLGIFYKYSLFGFRKRPQKQHLREKLKK